MQHDKTNLYLITIVSVVAIVFLITLFINTVGPVDDELGGTPMPNAKETPQSEDPSSASQEQAQGQEVRDEEITNGP